MCKAKVPTSPKKCYIVVTYLTLVLCFGVLPLGVCAAVAELSYFNLCLQQPDKLSPIKDKGQCVAAAKALGFARVPRVLTSPYFPPGGCFCSSTICSTLYFNVNGNQRQTQSGYKAVCSTYTLVCDLHLGLPCARSRLIKASLPLTLPLTPLTPRSTPPLSLSLSLSLSLFPSLFAVAAMGIASHRQSGRLLLSAYVPGQPILKGCVT